ncbi:MAG: hypothetical protein ACLP4R_28015, partial [Solirubrobacteraceae bacterium]
QTNPPRLARGPGTPVQESPRKGLSMMSLDPPQTAVVGLFGNAQAAWAAPFINTLRDSGISVFVAETDPQSVAARDYQSIATHLTAHPILIFAVDGKTYGTEALAMLGCALARARWYQHLIVWVDDPDEDRLTDQTARTESLHARGLVRACLRTFVHVPDVTVVESIDRLLCPRSRNPPQS